MGKRERLGGGAGPEIPGESAIEVNRAAEATHANIDQGLGGFVARVDNADALQGGQTAAQQAHDQVKAIAEEPSTAEQINTPEYKEAQKYANQLREYIATILESVEGDLKKKLERKLEKISKIFWFFCKEMALNDMPEFDYDSKIAMMDSQYHKTIAEINAVKSKFSPDAPSSLTEQLVADPITDDDVAAVMRPQAPGTVAEQINTPEYKGKAKKYVDKLREKMWGVIKLLTDKELNKELERAFEEIETNFWHFCKEVAQSDMTEFDRASKLKIMESRYQEALAEVDAVASKILAQKNPVDDERNRSEQSAYEIVLGKEKELPDYLKKYIDQAIDHLYRAMAAIKDKKAIPLLKAQYDNFLNYCRSILASKTKYEPKLKSILIEDEYEKFIRRMEEIFDVASGAKEPVTDRAVTLDDWTIDVPKNDAPRAKGSQETSVPATVTEGATEAPAPTADPKTDKAADAGEEPAIPEIIEKDLGYLDIDPKVIWEKLTPEDMQALQALMKAGDMAKVNAFYQTKIKEVLVDQKKESSADEELMKKMAESINAIIQQTVESEAEQVLAKEGVKNKGAMAAKIIKNVVILGGTSALVGSLGIATGGVGVAIGAGLVSLVRLGLRHSEKNRQKTTPDSVKAKARTERLQELDKKKKEILDNLFSADNLEILRRQLSGHIANTLREQTSERALTALKAYEQADGREETKILNARFRDVEKELYLSALTKMRAEHPEATAEQQQNMALTMALTIGQHERGENLARKRLVEIQKSKPALYAIIEKYNLLSAGSPDQKPAGMSKEEESIWQKSKYDLMSVGIGTAVGFAVRSSGIFRVAAGAVAGAGLGYRAGELMEQRDQKKALAEIVKMIDEAEAVIKDIEFPSDQIEKLKTDSVFVKSKLDLGLLDSDPLLKSRAENFIHQVQKIELANQESLAKLLATVSARTDKRAEQVEEDLKRIGSKIKNRRLWATIGGAVIGGAAAWGAGEIFSKKDEDQAVVPKPEDNHQPSVAPLAAKTPEVPVPTHFEDTVDSAKISGHDSIWRSTHQIFEDHPKELGYTGDINNHDAVSQWAETQTANAVEHLNTEQGGNLADLVHDGDKVRIDMLAGKPHLSFEASSGINAGHLPDTNVGHLVESQHFNAGIDHHMAIDSHTGDQYLELRSSDGVYKVYDWDRDAQPNVIFPDGHSQEMSTAELSKFLADKNIVSSPEALAAQEAAIKSAAEATTAQANETARQLAAQQQLEVFVSKGGQYNHDLFEVAKNSDQMDDLVKAVVNSDNQTQQSALVWDYARDHGWSEDKIGVFTGAMKSGGKLDLSSGHFDLNDPNIIARNMEAFEKAALDSFDKVKHMPSDHWMPARVGDQYFNVQKIHSGLWPARSDHWLIDTNGDFTTDAIKLDDHAMRAAFARDNIDLSREALEKLAGKK